MLSYRQDSLFTSDWARALRGSLVHRFCFHFGKLVKKLDVELLVFCFLSMDIYNWKKGVVVFCQISLLI